MRRVRDNREGVIRSIGRELVECGILEYFWIFIILISEF